jgi:hypothetical protein
MVAKSPESQTTVCGEEREPSVFVVLQAGVEEMG